MLKCKAVVGGRTKESYHQAIGKRISKSASVNWKARSDQGLYSAERELGSSLINPCTQAEIQSIKLE